MMIKFILVLSLFLTIQDGGVEALRFAPSPITVDTEVILINRPATLTCNYVKFKTESVREITWYAAYEGFRSKVDLLINLLLEIILLILILFCRFFIIM
jgi:hypothetical protein